MLIFIIIFVIGCQQQIQEIGAGQQEKIEEINEEDEVVNMKITSSAFENDKEIPSEFTCDGDNISPPLTISEVPGNATTLTLIMDDPDAPGGMFVHWVVWNIPSDTRHIPKGKEPEGVQGKTGFGRLGYGGPCPPSGTHRYFFKVYALSKKLGLKEGSAKEELEKAMQGNIVGKAQLMGRYKRH